MYYLSKLAAKDVKVVLSGEGADELFGGYCTYKESNVYKKYSKLPLGFRRVIRKIALHLPKSKIRRFLVNAGSSVEDNYIGQAFIMGNEEANEILNDDYKSMVKYQDITKDKFAKVCKKSELIKKCIWI